MKMMKINFADKKIKIAFCTCILSIILLVSVSFAWFVSIIDLPQNEINTGTLDFVAKGYDAEGNLISLIGDDETYIGSGIFTSEYIEKYYNKPLFNIENWSAGDATTVFISIEMSGTLDMDFSLSFVVSGLEEDLKNMGGYWYRVEKVKNNELDYINKSIDIDGKELEIGYDPLKANYGEVIKDYMSKDDNALVLCGDDCLQGTHKCTEFDIMSRNLVTIDHLAEYGTLSDDDRANNTHRCIYRIDLGLRKDAIEERYTNSHLIISGTLYGTQVGAINNPDGLGTVFTVTNDISLRDAIDKALPGDTIVLANMVKIDGDLIFNKCVNINTRGNDLIVNGNLIFNFVSKHVLKINLSSGGNIYVNAVNGAGGDLEVNTPNSEVLITGNSYTTNIYVEDEAYFNATNSLGTDGLFISGANILNKDGVPKDIYLEGHTRLTVDYGATIEHVIAAPNASNIEIINYGKIIDITLSGMLLIDDYPEDENADTGAPQIYIDNFNKIVNGILLPTWAKPFYEVENDKGNYPGNTVVIREWGAQEMSISQNSTFQTKDIIDHNIKDVCVVQKVPGRNDSLIVYYGDREDEVTSIESLLIEYFEEYNQTSGVMAESSILDVRHVEVVCLKDKEVSNADIDYLNAKMTGLTSIDLSHTKIVNDTLKTNAFNKKIELTSIVLPESLTTINAGALVGTSIKWLTIPASVTTYYYNSFTDIKYIIHNSLTAIAPIHNGHMPTYYSNKYFFVNEAVLADYQNIFPKDSTHSLALRVYPKGEVTDDGMHVVRKTSNGYELVCYLGTTGGDIRPGFNLSLKGEEVYITSIGQFCYTNVTESFDVILDDSITMVGNKAFYKAKVNSIDLNNVATVDNYAFYGSMLRTIDFGNTKYINDYAFASCKGLTYLDTNNVETIGISSFSDCTNLFEVTFPNVISIDANGFYGCTNLSQVSFYKIKKLDATVFATGPSYWNDILYLVRMYFYNDSLDDCEFGTMSSNQNSNFKIFIKEELVESLRETGITSNKRSIFPFCDIVGENWYSKTGTFNGESIFLGEINLGKYLVKGPADNAQFVAYNLPTIEEDFIVPGTVTTVDVYGNETVKTITSVGSYAFEKVRIENIYFKFDDSITTIADNLFVATTISYPTTVTYYINIRELDLNQVTNVGDNAFKSLTKLEKVTANNLVTLGKQAFYGCTNLKEVGLEALEILPESCFYNCTSLFTIYLPKVKVVEKQALYNTSDLLSIWFGPDLESIGADLIQNNQTKLREFIIESDIILGGFVSQWYTNKNLKIYLPHDSIPLQTSWGTFYREWGRKVGTYEVTNKDGTLTYNLGEYVIRDAEYYGTSGVSIGAYIKDTLDTPSYYEIPNELDGKKVIALGSRCYQYFDFNVIDTTLYDSGENFKFNDDLLYISSYAFYGTNIKVSDFKNIRYIDSEVFRSCKNIYIVNAPDLEYLGYAGFYDCTKLVAIDAPQLTEIGTSVFSATSLIKAITNIHTFGDAGLFNNTPATLQLLVINSDEGILSTIKNGSNIGNYPHKAVLSNDAMAKKWTNSAGIFDKNVVKLVNPYDYEVKDADGNVIYTFEMWEYVIKEVEGGVSIESCMIPSFYSDYTIPAVLDDKVVVSIGYGAYSGNTKFNGNRLIIPNTVTNIGSAAFSNCGISGHLNLNCVTTIGASTFATNDIISAEAPNLTTTSNNTFLNNYNFKSMKFGQKIALKEYTFRNCDKLEYIYMDELITFYAHDFTKKSNIIFILNKEVSKKEDIPLTNWSTFSDITMYVPYKSLEIYKERFNDETLFKNFTILPYGVVADDSNTGDMFILMESQGTYDSTTGTHERVWELISIMSNNLVIDIIDEWADPVTGEVLKVTKISENSFVGNAFVEITLPKYFKKYDVNTFINAGATLKNIWVDEDNANYISDNGVLYTIGYTELVCYPRSHDGVSYSIHGDTKVIHSYAFKDALLLENVIVSSDVSIIGLKAFEGALLTSIEFRGTVPYVSGSEIFDKNNTELIVYVQYKNDVDYYKSNSAFAYLTIISKEQ